MTDLSLVPTEELTSEIGKRFDGSIVCGIKYMDIKKTPRYYQSAIGLGRLELIGLIDMVKYNLMVTERAHTAPVQGEI